jgi:starch synthase
VHYDENDTTAFEADLAARVNELVGSPDRAAAMGFAGRARAVDEFGWAAIAERTVAIYESCGSVS